MNAICARTEQAVSNWMKKASLLVCALAVAAAGCGDDDDNAANGTGPANGAQQADAVEVMSVIRASAAGLDFAGLLTNPDGQTIPGESGELVITAVAWSFNSYSPDGGLVFDGQLNIGILNTPFTMRGDLAISGSKDADVKVDMTIAIVPDPDDPEDQDFEFGGTVNYNGVDFLVTDLLEATEAEGETNGDG